MKAQKIILIKEHIVIGASKIAQRIGYGPNDIAQLVDEGRLTAWQTAPRGQWKTTPAYIDEFNEAEAARFSAK